MPAYRWDVGAKRYRDTDTGRFLSREKALEYVDGALQAGRTATGTLANLVAEGTISAADWRDKMRQEIKDEYIRQYLSARGGLSQMTQADWGSIGGMLTEQYKYLDKFYGEVAAGNLTKGQIAARAGMYINSAREANERAHGRSQGLPDGSLPAYPADGSSECLTNDRCRWEIETVLADDKSVSHWNAHWRLSASEHCPTCLDRAAAWNPYVVKAGARAIAPVRRFAPDLTWRHGGSCTCGYCTEERNPMPGPL